jgi:hypothetical protein
MTRVRYKCSVCYRDQHALLTDTGRGKDLIFDFKNNVHRLKLWSEVDQVVMIDPDNNCHSTPVKVGTATRLPFTSNQKYRIPECTTMAEEMKGYLVGPMPIAHFLEDFFPKDSSMKTPFKFKPGCYQTTVDAKTELGAYEPFVRHF